MRMNVSPVRTSAVPAHPDQRFGMLTQTSTPVFDVGQKLFPLQQPVAMDAWGLQLYASGKSKPVGFLKIGEKDIKVRFRYQGYNKGDTRSIETRPVAVYQKVSWWPFAQKFRLDAEPERKGIPNSNGYLLKTYPELVKSFPYVGETRADGRRLNPVFQRETYDRLGWDHLFNDDELKGSSVQYSEWKELSEEKAALHDHWDKIYSLPRDTNFLMPAINLHLNRPDDAIWAQNPLSMAVGFYHAYNVQAIDLRDVKGAKHKWDKHDSFGRRGTSKYNVIVPGNLDPSYVKKNQRQHIRCDHNGRRRTRTGIHSITALGVRIATRTTRIRIAQGVNNRTVSDSAVTRQKVKTYKSRTNLAGSSSASFTRTRKVTASLPSTMRWS
jgi:hypothetical protein